MTRLSTGKRINTAKDDPGALQVAVRMEAEINGLTASLRNANDAQSAVDTGGRPSKYTLLLRMRELAVVTSSETSTTADRFL